jgi:hypothetical protein
MTELTGDTLTYTGNLCTGELLIAGHTVASCEGHWEPTVNIKFIKGVLHQMWIQNNFQGIHLSSEWRKVPSDD